MDYINKIKQISVVKIVKLMEWDLPFHVRYFLLQDIFKLKNKKKVFFRQKKRRRNFLKDEKKGKTSSTLSEDFIRIIYLILIDS